MKLFSIEFLPRIINQNRAISIVVIKIFILTPISSLGQIVSKPLSVLGLAQGLVGGAGSGHFGDNDRLCELHHFSSLRSFALLFKSFL